VFRQVERVKDEAIDALDYALDQLDSRVWG
jgi:hypothetical protein